MLYPGGSTSIFVKSKEEALPKVKEWLRKAFSEEKCSVLPKKEVFGAYLTFCHAHHYETTTPASFGKFLKQVFPRVETKRLIRNNKQGMYYWNLAHSVQHKPRHLTPTSLHSSSTTTTSSSSSSPPPLPPANSISSTKRIRAASFGDVSPYLRHPETTTTTNTVLVGEPISFWTPADCMAPPSPSPSPSPWGSLYSFASAAAMVPATPSPTPQPLLTPLTGPFASIEAPISAPPPLPRPRPIRPTPILPQLRSINQWDSSVHRLSPSAEIRQIGQTSDSRLLPRREMEGAEKTTTRKRIQVDSDESDQEEGTQKKARLEYILN